MFLGNQHCRNIAVRILEMLEFFSKNPTLDLSITATLGTDIDALLPQEINVAWEWTGNLKEWQIMCRRVFQMCIFQLVGIVAHHT